ncbi:hypothetical protein LSAT2_012329 [Lamellibrachia satsuma]|nr:hypothetical protein LSAT2_012329 [Lamellibrachia satsuma]
MSDSEPRYSDKVRRVYPSARAAAARGSGDGDGGGGGGERGERRRWSVPAGAPGNYSTKGLVVIGQGSLDEQGSKVMSGYLEGCHQNTTTALLCTAIKTVLKRRSIMLNKTVPISR